MWIRKTFLLSLVLAAKTVYTNTMDSQELCSSIAQFSAKFCNELNKGTSVVSSPLSAEFVLALLTLGTSEPAHSELLKSLGLPDDDAIRSSFSSVSSKLKSIQGVTLNVANKVYIKEGEYDLDAKLKEDAVKVFDAALEKINFDDGAAAADLINKWVENKTNEKIKKLLSDDSLDGNTRLVLLNAIYFKGTWKKRFDPQNTIEQPFNIDSQKTVDVQMMYKEDNYLYGESAELGAQLLQIPYVGDEATMLIVLPNEIEGLDGILKKLADGHDLLAELDRMHDVKVQVSIPKFKIETEIDLTSVLTKLGIKAIFDSQNSGITKLLNKPEPLFVSKAVQKAFIEVNEEGAEAAAATVMGIAFCSAIIGEPIVKSFVADRPFLAAIISDRTIYFLATQRGQ